MGQQFSVNLGLPEKPLADDKVLFGELLRVYNAIRNLAYAFDYITGAISPEQSIWNQLDTDRVSVGGMCKIYLPAYENLIYGDIVGIQNVSSIGQAKKALQGTLYAVGFCSVQEGTQAGFQTEVTFLGRYPPFDADILTPGSKYYLSGTTAGTIAATGTQVIGFAATTRDLIWLPQL